MDNRSQTSESCARYSAKDKLTKEQVIDWLIRIRKVCMKLPRLPVN